MTREKSHPRFGLKRLQGGKAVEYTGHDQARYRTTGERRGSEESDRETGRPGLFGQALAAHESVLTDGHVQLTARRPDRVILGIVEVLHLLHDVGRHQHSRQAVLASPSYLRKSVVQITEEDLGQTNPPAWQLPAKVRHPAIVGPDAGKPEFVITAILGRVRRRRRGLDTGGIEGRGGVRKQDLGRNTLSFDMRNPPGRIPVRG